MPENPSYLDRLYNEIGQYGDRLARTIRGPYGFSEVAKNWTTPYETTERQQEAMRLAAQQAKEEYMAQQNAGQLSLKDAKESQRIREDIGKRLQALRPDASYLAEQERLRMQAAKEGYMAQQDAAQTPAQDYQQPGIPGLEDPYAQYLYENRNELKNPEYAAPTREEYQKYFVEGQALPKAVPVAGAVAEMAASTPKQAAARQQAPAQPQRPMTIGEQIDMLPFEGDRYEARRKVLEKAKQTKINEAYAYANSAYPGGTSSVEGDRFLKNALEQIKQTHIIPSPIEETESFKAAKEAIVSGKHADRMYMLGEMKGLLETAKGIKDQKEKVAFLELNLPKLAQSIAAGADAIQPAEASRIMPELNTVWQNPSEALQLFGRKGLGAFAKQPDAFIDKLGKIYNSTIPVINERSAGYQDNLGAAFKKLGVGYLSPIGTKNQGVDMTKLQQLREGRNVQQPIFSQVSPSSYTYGSKPIQTGY